MNTDKLSKRYIRQELLLTVALFLIGLLVMRVWYMNDMLWPLVVSAVFSLVASYVIGFLWRRIARTSPDSLPTFFTATSGFRMLAALAVMFVYYLIVGRESMLTFILVFLVFYFASLIHHSVFFSRVSNRM
ncbi:MAG: hypothetical protein K6C10_05415 [Prevotella sp.]|nr:hypothetical protein [Prevotella sp.]